MTGLFPKMSLLHTAVEIWKHNISEKILYVLAYEILCTSRRTFQKVFPYLAQKPHIAALRLAQEQRRHTKPAILEGNIFLP